MRLLVVGTDSRDAGDYADAARSFGRTLSGYFDRVLPVDRNEGSRGSDSANRDSLGSEAEAQRITSRADFAVVLSCTSPDGFARYPHAINVGLSYCETEELPRRGAEQPWIAHANAMDALWVPNAHSKRAFERAGVTVPLRIAPCPVCLAKRPDHDVSEGAAYDLNRRPLFSERLIHLARFRGNLLRLQGLTRQVGPMVGRFAVKQLECDAETIFSSSPLLLCAGRDEPRQALRLLLAEWMEFRRRAPNDSWSLLIHTAPGPKTPRFDLVIPLWEHVQALKRQLGIQQARVFLWNSEPECFEPTRWLERADALVVSALGVGFDLALTTALSMSKPVICPRHAADEAVAHEEAVYGYETRQAILSFMREPRRPFDPVSAWQVPAPHGVAEAFSRLAADWKRGAVRPIRALEQASGQHWFGDEIKRLEAAFVDRFTPRPQPHAAPRLGRRRSVST
jgi:hypothetical protein